MSIDTQYYQNYVDQGISVIPNVKRWDEKKGVYSGKFPAISKWSDLCKELPDDEQVESWASINGVTGISYLCGEASNLACVDIDTEDLVLSKQIEEVLPYTPCRIIGHPKRYGKLLYRITDRPATFNFDSIVKKRQVKRGKEVVADIFMGNAYIVAPPSVHSTSRDNKNITYYRWYDDKLSLERVGIDKLPVLPPDAFYKISQLSNSATSHTINLNLSDVNVDDTEGGRHSEMKRLASIMIRKREEPTKVIAELMQRDKTLFPNNQYFLDKTKGCATSSPMMNATKFYSDMLVFCNQGGAVEIPNLSNTSPCHIREWPEVRPLQEQKIIQDNFDIDLVPEVWRDLVRDVSDSNGVPPEICFYLLLTILSSLIGNKRVITAKKKNKSWEEAFNIWTILVSPSGTRKSQVVKTLSKYAVDIQKGIDDDYQEYTHYHARQNTIKDELIKQLDRKFKKEIELAVNENDGKISKSAQKELDRILDNINNLKEESEIIPKKQIVAKGVTVEKLIEIIAANKHGTMLEYNELTELTSLFRKKGYESLRTLLLDSWDGLRPYSYQTKNSGEVFIEKNCTSMYASVQTSIFKKELQEISKDINDDGFYQRSFIVVNDSPVAKAIDEEFDISKYKNAEIPFKQAYNMGDSKRPVETSKKAYDLLMRFEQGMLEMSVSEKISALSSFWGKFTGKVVKVAGLIEFLEKGPDFKEISYKSMLKSVKLMERQIIHIKNMFPDPILEHSREIIRLVNHGVIQDGIDHDRLVKKYGHLRDSKTCKNVIDTLISHNVIDIVTRNSKYYYYFNPAIKSIDS